MIASSFVQQTGVFSSLLVVICFAVLVQLLSTDKKDRAAFIRIGLFVTSGLLLLISTWISMWLAMALDPWREVAAQGQPIPQHVIETTGNLAAGAVWPFFLGIVSFFGGITVTGWVHSRVAGIITVIAGVIAFIIMIAIWAFISPALRTS
jgi:hypothetical protein